jgi:hypothetical protein
MIGRIFRHCRAAHGFDIELLAFRMQTGEKDREGDVMKLLVEYPVLAQVLPARASNRKAALLLDAVEVDVPEIAASDIPVSLSWITKHANGHVARRVDYHAHDDAFYVRVPAPPTEDGVCRYAWSGSHHERKTGYAPFHDILDRRIASTLASLVERHQSGLAAHLFDEGLVAKLLEARVKLVQPTHRPPLITEQRFREADHEGIAADAAAFRERMSRFVVSGGDWFMRVPEPVWTVTLTKSGPGGGAAEYRAAVTVIGGLEPVEFHLADTGPETMYFRADDVEAAEVYAVEIARRAMRLDDDPQLPPRSHELVFHGHAPLAFRDEAVTLLSAAETMRRRFLSSMMPGRDLAGRFAREDAKRAIEDLSVEAFSTFKRLDAEVRLMGEAADMDLVATLVREGLVTFGADRLGFGAEEGLFELAASRWEKRELRTLLGIVPL